MSPPSPRRSRSEPAPADPAVPGPALGLLEIESIARGIVVVDALVKKAQVAVVVHEPVTPGKYLIVFLGEVAEVEESLGAAVETGGALVMDRLMLPQVADVVRAAIGGQVAAVGPLDAVGIVETHTVAAAIRAADTAVKRSRVKLTRLHLAKGIGGKGYFLLAGEQHDVEAALEGAAAAIEPTLLVATELIQRPHADLPGRVV